MVYTNYTSMLSAVSNTPVGPSVVVDSSTDDASSRLMFSTITWTVVACCVLMNT